MRGKFVGMLVAMLLLAPLPSAVAAGSAVRINEVSCAGVDWIELYNSSTVSVELSNWLLSDREAGTARHQFVIPRATVIPAKGFLVFEQGTLSNQLAWGVDCSKGETIYLSEPGGLTPTLVDSLQVPIAVGAYTFGRIPNGANTAGNVIASRGKSNVDARSSLLSAKVISCKAARACKAVLKFSNKGTATLAKAVTGVKLSGTSLTITARKKQTLSLNLKVTNAAGSRLVRLTVRVV